MIRLLAIDLDGTLFSSQQQISRKNKQAIYRARSAGIHTAIVTGRGRSGAEMALDMLDMDIPFICSAGSLVCKSRRNGILSARTFEIKEELLRIVTFARDTDSGLIADSLDGNWWFGPDELGKDLDPMTAAYAWKSRRTYSPEVDFLRPILKLTLVADHDVLERAEYDLCSKCPSLHHVYAGMRYMDLTREGVNKGTALEILAGSLNIRPKEIAAVGDQPIDISMLEYAGLPVAMGNAPEVVKQSAKWVAPTNDEDGVDWVINRILTSIS